MLKSKRHPVFGKPLLYGVLVFGLVFIINQTINFQRIQLQKKTERQDVNTRVLQLKEDLQEILGQSFTVTQTMSFIVEHYGIPENFDSIAKLLLKSNRNIDALELVDGEGVITHVYPKKGNDVIGFNVLKDSIGKDGALTTLERKDNFTAGPIRLKQGGVGFVTRSPLFQENKFTGFTAAVVRLSTIVKAANLDTTDNSNFSCQLAKIKSDQSEEIFYASKKIATEQAIKIPLTTAHGEWKLYVISNREFSSMKTFLFLALGILLSTLCGTFVWFLARQPSRLNQLVQEKTALLKESQENYRTLVEQASDGIIVSNKLGEILDVNIMGAQMFGYTKNEIKQKNFNDLVSPDDLAQTPLRYFKINKENAFLSERKLIRKDGSVFYGEIKSKELPNSTVQGIIRDFTQRKELEKNAQQNLQKFSKAFNNSTIGMAIKDQNKRFVDANAYFLKLIGFSIEEIKGKTIPELGLIDIDQSLKICPDMATYSSFEKIDRMEVALRTKTGKVLHVLTSLETYEYLNEKFSLTTYIDQTEAKKATLEIELSEKKYRNLTERISDAFVAIDKNWNFTYINNKAAKIIGIEPTTMNGKNIWEEFPFFKQSIACDMFINTMKSQSYTYFEQFHTKDGRWIENHLYPSPEGMTIYFSDVTKKKLAEQENQKLISIIENSPGFIGLTTLSGDSLYLNEAGKNLVGFGSQKEITNVSLLEFFPEKYRDMVVNEHLPSVHKNGVWRGEAFFKNFETNEEVPIEISGFLIRDKVTNEPIGIGCIAFDLTERKKTQTEILELQSKMNAAIRVGKIGYWNWDMSNEIVEWSKEMYHIHNIEPGITITVEMARELIHIKDRHILDNKLKEQMGKGETTPSIYRICLEENSFKHILAYSELIYNENDEPIKYHGTAMDITKSVLAEEALKESQEQFTKAFENNLTGMIILDQNRKVIEANNATYNLLNVNRNQLIGKSVVESGAVTIQEEDRKKIWEKFLIEGKIINEEFKIKLKNGERKSLLISIEPLLLNSKENYLVNLIDDTKRKEAEKALELQNIELKKTNSELDSFVYSASHELRAPLSSILGLISLILREDNEPNLVLHLNMMEKSIKRLDDFIKDIIAYSRNKHLDLQLDSIKFTNLIEDSVQSLWYLEHSQKIKINVKVNDTVSFVSDKKRISTLLNNFISNAIKYHDLNKVSPAIWISIMTNKKEAVIEIKDNGTGMEEKQLDKIFEMFYRISSKVMGSGIGLFIVKEILDKLNGSIEVKSKVGVGSTFIIKLPNESKKINP